MPYIHIYISSDVVTTFSFRGYLTFSFNATLNNYISEGGALFFVAHLHLFIYIIALVTIYFVA